MIIEIGENAGAFGVVCFCIGITLGLAYYPIKKAYEQRFHDDKH